MLKYIDNAKKTILSHKPETALIPAKLDAIPTEKGLVMAAEKPKQEASKHTPNPVIVSKPKESINITINGRRVTNSSNSPNKLPKSIKNKTQAQITSFFFVPNLFTMVFIITFKPLVLSSKLNTPLITSKNRLIIIMVMPPSSMNTLKGAVITRQNSMPETSPLTKVPAIIWPFASREKVPCGIIKVKIPLSAIMHVKTIITEIKDLKLIEEKDFSFVFLISFSILIYNLLKLFFQNLAHDIPRYARLFIFRNKII